jgi:hypothetical protein
MPFYFNPAQGVIQVQAELEGPTGTVSLRLTLDTGATRTVIDGNALVAAGYNLALAGTHLPVTTAAGVMQIPMISVARLKSLGQERFNLPILAHTFPATASGDGVLGLDFFRGLLLTIDFRQGEITVV